MLLTCNRSPYIEIGITAFYAMRAEYENEKGTFTEGFFRLFLQFFTWIYISKIKPIIYTRLTKSSSKLHYPNSILV